MQIIGEPLLFAHRAWQGQLTIGLLDHLLLYATGGATSEALDAAVDCVFPNESAAQEALVAKAWAQRLKVLALPSLAGQESRARLKIAALPCHKAFRRG